MIFLRYSLPFLALLRSVSAIETKRILDAFAKLVGEEEYDADVYDRLFTCLVERSTPDLDLVLSSYSGWDHFLVFGNNSGNPDGTDNWNSFASPWIELNPTPLSEDDDTLVPGATTISILEPCNTVSNFAYYRSAINICEYPHWIISEETVSALVLVCSTLAYGSSFFHASRTLTGSVMDTNPIRMLALIGHQALFEGLSPPSLLLYIDEEPLDQPALDTAFQVGKLLIDVDTEELLSALRVLDDPLPSYEKTWSGSAAIILHLIFPERVATTVGVALTGLLTPDNVEFVTDEYTPALLNFLEEEGIRPSFQTRLSLLFKFSGTMLKLLFAFLWQEEVIPGCHLYNPYANILAARLLPRVSRLANILNGFDHSQDFDVQKSKDVYPGDARCRREQPHSKWHEGSANGLIDLLYLTNAASVVLKGEQVPLGTDVDLLQCIVENHCLAGVDFPVEPLARAAEDCFPFIASSWAAPDTEGFFNCATASLLYAGADAMEGVKANKLDTCLIENECIGFDAFGMLDTRRLVECMGLNIISLRRRAPCRNMLNRPKAFTCFLRCQGGRLCLLGCLHQHGDFSSAGHSVLGCGLALADPDGPMVDNYLETCRVPTVEEAYPSSFVWSLALTLPFISNCGLEACLGLSLGFRDAAARVLECAADCRNDSLFGPLLYYFLPRSAACTIQCYLQSGVNLSDLRDIVRDSPDCPLDSP